MSAVSHEFRMIFVRVPRTGSTTFLDYFHGFCGPHLTDKGSQHASALELRELWGQTWEDYFTFGFIRNPWDWLVSVYNSGVSVGARDKEPWAGAPLAPGQGVHEGQRMNATFEEWVLSRKTTPMHWLSDDDGNILVDRIYRLEDWRDRWGIKRSDFPHSPYQEWYSEDLAGYVEDMCQAEIRQGGYSFRDGYHLVAR